MRTFIFRAIIFSSCCPPSRAARHLDKRIAKLPVKSGVFVYLMLLNRGERRLCAEAPAERAIGSGRHSRTVRKSRIPLLADSPDRPWSGVRSCYRPPSPTARNALRNAAHACILRRLRRGVTVFGSTHRVRAGRLRGSCVFSDAQLFCVDAAAMRADRSESVSLKIRA